MKKTTFFNKSCLYIFALILLTAAILGFVFISDNVTNIAIADSAATATDNSAQGNYDSYTDSDAFIFNNQTYTIQEYSSKVYQSTSQINKSGLNLSLSANADDAIVKIVPRQLFYTAGECLYIGKEYGFYVYTAYDFTYNHYRSQVMVFDITNNVSYLSNNGVLDFSVSPLFQYEYVFVESKTKTFIIKDSNGVNNSVSCSIASGTYVVPIAALNNGKVVYQQKIVYYLKDISYDMALFNEQTPNEGNGVYYDPYKDLGAYFTYFDYKYTGHAVENGEDVSESAIGNALGDIIKIGLSWAKTFPGLGYAINAIELGLRVHEIANHGVTLLSEIENKLTPKNVTVSNGKITASNFFANRDDQIRNYGKLMKNATIVVNQHEGKNLWYTTGEKATGYFQVGHSALNTAANLTRINRTIALGVTNKTGYEKYGMSTYGYSLHSPDYKPVQMDYTLSDNVFLLPEGVNYFKFNPTYSSDYSISLNFSQPVEVYHNDVYLGSTATTYMRRMNKNSNNLIKIVSKGAGAIGKLSISPSISKNFSYNQDDEYIFKYVNIEKSVKNFSASNVIENVFTLENGNLVKYTPQNFTYTGGYRYSLPMDVGAYYFTLKKSNLTTENLSVENATVLSKEITKNSLMRNITYFKYVVPKDGNYTVTIDDESLLYNINAIDVNFNNLAPSVGAGIARLNGLKANQVIYIGMHQTSQNVEKIVNIGINEYSNSYKWRINGKDYAPGAVTLERGTEYTVNFIVNNSKIITEFDLIANNCQLTMARGKIYINENCAVGGSGFYLHAYFDKIQNLLYGDRIQIIPKHEEKISFTVDKPATSDKVNLKITKLSEVTSAKFKLTYGGTNYTTQFVLNFNSATSVVSEIFSKINSAYQNASVTVTEITYKGQTRSYNNPNISRSFDTWFYKGSGTAASPYIIRFTRHFNNISKKPTAYFKQAAKLDFLSTSTARNVVFKGVYDANNQDIVGINLADYTVYPPNSGTNIGGLFDSNYGTIKNIRTLNVNLSFSNTDWIGINAGCVVGRNYNSGKIQSISNITGYIRNMRDFDGTTGGVTGKNDGKISSCKSSLTISAYGDVGGIAGVNTVSGIIDNCTHTGTINYFQAVGSINKSAGGIAGYNVNIVENSQGNGNLKYSNDIRSESITLMPCIALVVAFNGKEGNNVGQCINCSGSGYVDPGNLHTVKYYQFPKNRTWNQAYFAVSRPVARQL